MLGEKMRSREIYIICKKELKRLRHYSEMINEWYRRIGVNENGVNEVIQFNSVYNMFYNYARNIFRDIPYLNEQLLRIAHYEGRNTEEDAFPKISLADEFFRRVDCIISLYEPTEMRDEVNLGLDIKIPETDNITELKKYIDGLEFIFTKCPFFQSNEASLILRNVDNG